MTKKLIKISIALLITAAVLSSALTTNAYPPFVRKAQKFGAKDCLFCHKEAEGGEREAEPGQRDRSQRQQQRIEQRE